MAFCPYCGKQLSDGEVCACTLAGAAGTGVSGPRLPENFVTQPVHSAPERPAPTAVSEPPAGSYPPPPPPAPRRPAPAPESDTLPTPPAAPQPAPSQQSAPDAPPKSASALSEIINPLIERAKLLVSKPEEAISRAIHTNDLSWVIVYGIYTLLGSFAAAFALPRFLTGFFGRFATYGDMLTALFGQTLWRGMLINLFTLAIALGIVMGVCGVTKTRLPFARALNFVSMAFVPAALLNVPGLLMSFFFPAGTLICGIISAVCTIVILCVGLASLVEKKNLWLYVISSSAMVLLYALVLYLFTDGMFTEVISNLISNAFWY